MILFVFYLIEIRSFLRHSKILFSIWDVLWLKPINSIHSIHIVRFTDFQCICGMIESTAWVKTKGWYRYFLLSSVVYRRNLKSHISDGYQLIVVITNTSYWVQCEFVKSVCSLSIDTSISHEISTISNELSIQVRFDR